jgi:hypothetical protein
MSKRENEHLPLSQLLKSFVRDNKLEAGLDQVEVREAWIQLMGNGVNNYTEAVNLHGQKLHIKLTSSVLREELSYGKEKIISMLNEHLGKELIKELYLK